MSNAKDPARMNSKQASTMVPEAPAEANAAAKEQVRINGFQQVIDMLRVADPAFRESLLKRLALRDRELANQLRLEFAAQNN